MKSSTAENFMRSAKAPTMRAGVMQAKVIWKMTKASSGMLVSFEKVAGSELGVTPASKNFEKPPMKGLREAEALPVKASE